MDRQNPLQPFWVDNSRTDGNALSQEPRDRHTRDENAGGTMFHTRSASMAARQAAEALVRKRLHDQEDGDSNKKRTIGDSSLPNSDALTSDDYEDEHDRIVPNSTLFKTSSRPSNASSESFYFFNKVPSSPPAYLSQHADIPSSPQREPPQLEQTPEQDRILFTSQATMVPPSDPDHHVDFDDSDDSDSTVDFNINTLNRVHGYISSDHLASEPTYNDYNDEEAKAHARSRIANCIEDGNPKVYMESLGLKTLPDDIEDLSNLVCWVADGIRVPKIEIYATHNKLKILPHSLFNVSNLSVLSLRDNKLKKVPGKISHLQKLAYLSISSNEIKVLPYQILKLPLLTNLLVRPNMNLIELRDQPSGSFFCVGIESREHDVDVRRFVSKVKWIHLPMSSSSSQMHPSLSNVTDREICQRMSPVPKLSELALRKFCKYSVTLTETRRWKRDVPIYRQKMITKALQKGLYEETCSICDHITVNPIAKALEWWDFRNQTLVPVRRNFCCANCVKQWLDDVEMAKKKLEDGDDQEDEDEDMNIQDHDYQGEGSTLRIGAGGLQFDDDF